MHLRCILAYSDISAEYVLELATRVLVAGADFLMLAPHDTFLDSTKPVRNLIATYSPSTVYVIHRQSVHPQSMTPPDAHLELARDVGNVLQVILAAGSPQMLWLHRGWKLGRCMHRWSR